MPASDAVSVIVATYNRASLLRRTLASVLAQTVAPLEILVADDGSTDETAEVVRAFGSRVTHLPLSHRGAPAGTRNAGLARARGSWVAFIDDDDLWVPDKLAQQLALAKNDTGLVCCNAELIDENDAPLGRCLHEAHPLAKEPDSLRALIGGNFVVCSSVLARTELLRASGGFHEGPELRRLAEDYDLWLRCALRARFHYAHEPWVRYRVSGGGISQGTPSLAQAEALAAVRRRFVAAVGARATGDLAAPLRQNWRRLQHARYKGYAAEGRWLRALAPWAAVQAAKIRGRH